MMPSENCGSVSPHANYEQRQSDGEVQANCNSDGENKVRTDGGETGDRYMSVGERGRPRLHTATQLILLAAMVVGLLVFIGGIIWWSLHVAGFIEVMAHA